MLVLHDFADPHNDDPNDRAIGVREAVRSTWVARECDLLREVGVCGVFRRRTGPEPQSPMLNAVALDGPRLQWLQRVRWPAERLARRWLDR